MDEKATIAHAGPLNRYQNCHEPEQVGRNQRAALRDPLESAGSTCSPRVRVDRF